MAEIYPLSEGVFTVGHDKEFVPFDVAADELNDRARGSLLVEIQPFLVVTQQDVILLDAGLGYKNQDGVLQIHANLAKHGYRPDQVTKVLMSHLHKDHAGGVTFEDATGAVLPSFPEAVYYIYKPEADFAMKTGRPSFFPEDIEPLFASQQVEWLQGQEGAIDDTIRFMHSGGHSPQHIVFVIDDGQRKIFYGGDEAPQLKQMKIKYVAKYDFDGKKAMALREQYAAQGHREGWEFLFYHDVKTPSSKL